MSDWQPIETAPKDETIILAGRFDGGYSDCAVVFWDSTGTFGTPNFPWCIENATQTARHKSWPTHWQPLPKPPTA